ncbi:MAG: hypothetical protein ACI9OO_000508 [Bacteroidia bacterium]|jgi:hypothetical protein
MTRIFSIIAFALGAFVVLWMGSSFIHSNALALLVTILIAGAYTAGFTELLRYQKATATLERALNSAKQPVSDLVKWLSQLCPTLRFAVRQRIYGEATGLPAPLLTPYLVGLLVMLGLLGTFIGMVETLQGAVGALQGSTELDAVRKGLAVPIQGLGMAFATSVAGVTASAMLGLISTLSRKQRLEASRHLDSEMAGVFKLHSLSYQRRQTYEVLQAQSAALPAVAEQLSVLATQLDERMQVLADKLSNSQESLQQSLSGQYQQLSSSVESALSDGFRDTGRLAAESAQPILKEFAARMAAESKNTHEQFGSVVAQQLSVMSEQLGSSSDTLRQNWQAALNDQQQANEHLLEKIVEQVESAQSKFSEGAGSLQSTLQQANGEWLRQWQEAEQQKLEQWRSKFELSAESLTRATADIVERSCQRATETQNEIARLLEQSAMLLNVMQQRDAESQSEAAQRLGELVTAATTQLQALREDEQERGKAAVAQLAQLQETSAKQLAALGESLEAPLSRLIETASDAPRAAAEVIEQLRGEIGKNIERDNALLAERQQTMTQLNALSASLEENARLQREAVQALLEESGQHLATVGQEFGEKVSAESNSLGEQMAHFSASAAELSALGEVFNNAVEHFGESNTQLIARLEQIETVLTNSGQRSDQQMEYYLSQAREIIDHNLLSHQELLGHVRESNGKQG